MRLFFKLLILLIILAAGGIGFYFYSQLHTSIEHPKSNQYITVDYGSSPGQIIKVLERETLLNQRYQLNYTSGLLTGTPICRLATIYFPHQ